MSQKQALLTMLKHLYEVSGFRMTLFDASYQGICSYPEKTSFCQLIHENNEACQLCHTYDQQGFQKAAQLGEVYLYQCYFGLYEAIAPLYYCGELTGYLMMGQTLSTSKFDKEATFNISKNFVKDTPLLKQAIDELTTHTKEKLNACAAIMEICASYITLTHQVKVPELDLPLAIKEYIHYFYYRPIHLEDLCHHFHCSKATLTNAFKDKYGISIHQYLVQYRLKQAQTLLKQPQLPIKQIASQCGFTDPNYFTKAFVQAYNTNPTQYRQEIKNCPE